MINLEVDLLHDRPSDQKDVVLQFINEYDEIKNTIDHVMCLLPFDHKRKPAYNEWNQRDKDLKLKLTEFASSKHEYSQIYKTLNRLKWIVT
jgi:hypothetical protein